MCGTNQESIEPVQQNIKHESILQIAAKTQLNASQAIQRALCAMYARDYLCLGYSLPTICQSIEDQICETIFVQGSPFGQRVDTPTHTIKKPFIPETCPDPIKPLLFSKSTT
eukprot:CAMPEP_0197356342 /NCGR_PEP_ID=MMETSP0893-20130614/48844_1 /TAXON_ID=44058 ORGANISM="Aureoumbra lagunensis, Strain CCMP1510" /NCGR_SAMPLE_ID=MMETSP0893 /ASSEMBLY_ACC=CAM_ASM_000539 /LENGTH=111 /DNA_ID=CAMNT_0042873943 /DNA_START=886 /DNA_END=1217 /DNA_ORIENTATION=-